MGSVTGVLLGQTVLLLHASMVVVMGCRTGARVMEVVGLWFGGCR